MRSYLSLIKISAKIRRRQNRMTILCIIFAVSLVTAIFSMAEMGVRIAEPNLLTKYGLPKISVIMNTGMGKSLLPVTIFLFILVLIAGVLMISGSINSNVAQRTKFFGMMRCIGMSKQQIIRFVRLESLNWCKTAIPIGTILGVVVTWILCLALHFAVGGEFRNIPIFGVSIIGIISGIILGIVTVLLAARSPARKAAKVSPIAAVSGNCESMKNSNHRAYTRFFKVETALGIRHATSIKKNLFLVIGSFALSIILFMGFSVFVNLVDYLLPHSSSTADVEVHSSDGSNSLGEDLLSAISGIEGVKHVSGVSNLTDIPAKLQNSSDIETKVKIISYDKFDLDSFKKDKLLQKGSDISKVYGDSNCALAIYDEKSPLKIGDKIQIGSEELEIAGLLPYDPFNMESFNNGKTTIITSNQTFSRLSKAYGSGYTTLRIQTNNAATDETVDAIYQAVGNKGVVEDERDYVNNGTRLTFFFFVYGFLVVIMLITALSILNCISMSVSSRIKQYGAMRAVGMTKRQLTKMIVAETLTYALSGCVVGCVVGTMINKSLYNFLITSHFSYAIWELPIAELLVILLFVLLSAAFAIYSPAKRMRKMAITETINEL